MHRARLIFGITALFLTTGAVVTAQRGQSGAPKPPHTTSTGPKAAPSPHSTSKTAKPATSAQTKMATKPKTMKPASTPKTAKATKGSSPTATTSSDTTTTGTRTPVQEKLQKNANLASTLTSRLPAGTDLMTASAGFRNLGQFVATVNVSNNLGISFTQLKTKMVTDGMSLGQAIQALRPVTSATIEAQRAEYDARGMIAESERQPPVTAATTTSATTSSKSKAKPKKHAQ